MDKTRKGGNKVMLWHCPKHGEVGYQYIDVKEHKEYCTRVLYCTRQKNPNIEENRNVKTKV